MTALSDSDLDDFADWMADHDLSRETIRHRRTVARSFARGRPTIDVAPRDVSSWLRQRDGWTRVSYDAALRLTFQWAHETGRATTDPMGTIRRPPQPRGRPRPLPRQLVDVVLDSAHHHRDADMYAWMCLGLYAGLRRFEIAKFRGEHITEQTIVVLGKGSVEDYVPTHPELWRLASLYPRRGYWFPGRNKVTAGRHVSENTVNTAITQHLRDCGVETGSSHRLRHTFVTSLSRAGARTRVVQKLARHASVSTTMLYDAAEADELRDGISRLHFGTGTIPAAPAA